MLIKNEFYPRTITKDSVREAFGVLKKYKAAKENLEQRIIENEIWWKMRHWDIINRKNGFRNINDPQPASAWLFNSIANKHADVMDNFPQPNILPREKRDIKDAEDLSRIVPVILEERNFEEV